MEDLPPVPRPVYVTGREDASREKTCVVKMRVRGGKSVVDRGAGALGGAENNHLRCGQSGPQGFWVEGGEHLLRGQGFPQGLHRDGGEPAGHRPLKLPRRRQHISAPSSCGPTRARSPPIILSAGRNQDSAARKNRSTQVFAAKSRAENYNIAIAAAASRAHPTPPQPPSRTPRASRQPP